MTETYNIILPDDNADITLSQYMRFQKLQKSEDMSDFDKAKRVLHIFCDIPKQKLNDIKDVDFIDCLQHVTKAINTEREFTARFKVGEIEYGFIPNFDNLTAREFFDLNLYSDTAENLENNLDRVMSILFRPVIKSKKNGDYKIQNYRGTEAHIEDANNFPMSVVQGALGFFLTLSKELRNHIQKSMTQQELERVMVQ